MVANSVPLYWESNRSLDSHALRFQHPRLKRAIAETELSKGEFADLHTIGYLDNLQNRSQKSVEMYQQALRGAEKALGFEHHLTLDILINLGNAYRRIGKLKEVEEMLQQTFREQEKTLGFKHSLTLGTILNLGTVYTKQQKWKKVKETLQRALKETERTLEPHDMLTLLVVHSLAYLNLAQGKLVKAEEMYQRVLMRREKTHTFEHSSMLEISNNLSILYTHQGKLQKTEKMYQRALKEKEKEKDFEHSSMFRIRNNLSNLYIHQDKLKEIEEMLLQYLLFLIVIAEMTLSNLFDDDSLDMSIRHLTFDQFIISLECFLDALKLSTFYDMNCRVDRDDLNDSEIMRKDEDLTQQMH